MNSKLLIILIFVILNIFVFLLYGLDKRKAKKHKWRISEKTLIAFGALCPWGAIIGMHYFHHKTQKSKFMLNYVFAVLHILLAIVLIMGI